MSTENTGCDEVLVAPSPRCEWREDNDGNWDTKCGECFCFEHSPPYEMRCYKFCPSCGKKIVFVKYTPHDKEIV